MSHQSFKRPESVLVLVYTTVGEVLVLRRRAPPDFWQSVTGSLEWDENDPLDTARRELDEETGITPVELHNCGVINRFAILPQWRHRYQEGVTENTEYLILAQLPQRVPVRLNPNEHSEYCWLPRREAAERMTSWTNREAVLRFVPEGS